jgi:hypothetical protein
MNCRNCGLPVEEGEEFNAWYQTRWRHSPRDGEFTKFVSCAYANGLGCTSDLYPYPQTAATPDDKEGGAGTAFLLAPEQIPYQPQIVINVLPPVSGRRFR